MVPLWQLTQVAVGRRTSAWLVVAGVQPLVVWHATQLSEVAMWPLVL